MCQLFQAASATQKTENYSHEPIQRKYHDAVFPLPLPVVFVVDTDAVYLTESNRYSWDYLPPIPQTLAIFLCATLALGSCSGSYGGGHHGGSGGYGQGHRELSSYGQRSSGGGAAAASAAAAAPVEIIAGGPRYGGSEHLRPILLDSGYGNSGSQYGQEHGHGHGHSNNNGNIYGAQQQHSYGGHQQQSYGGHHQQNYGAAQQSYGNQQRGYGGRPRWSVQPAGATVLYPGQNSYRKYASAPEYTKVLLPVRAAPPVAKLYIPENNYGNQGGYQAEQSSY